jgi:tetratricopeptide (TPR) repeat protein
MGPEKPHSASFIESVACIGLKRASFHATCARSPCRIRADTVKNNVDQLREVCVHMAKDAARYPNQLRDLIKQAGLTVKEVADESGIPLRTLFDYCGGKVPIPRKKLEDIALVIGCSSRHVVPAITGTGSNLLQYSQEQTNDWIPMGVLSSLDTLRRDLLIQMSKLATVAGISLLGVSEEILNPDAWERLLATLEKPSRIDEAALIHLEKLTDTYWSLYRTAIAKTDLLSSVTGHLMTVARLLKSTQPVAVQFRLCSVASNAAQILGEIYYDLDNIEEAKAYYRLGARAAEEVDNHPLQATALGREGFLPVYLGKPQEALPLLHEAENLADERVTGQTKAWISMMEAEALARIDGKKEACLSVLKKVDAIFYEEAADLEEAPNRDDRKWTGFTLPTLTGYKGTCFLHLHQPEEARSMLLIALGDLPPGPTRRRSLILTDLATAYLQSQEIEEACNTATQALVYTAQSKSSRSLQRLRNFQKTLRPWRDLASVRRFNSAMKILEVV